MIKWSLKNVADREISRHPAPPGLKGPCIEDIHSAQVHFGTEPNWRQLFDDSSSHGEDSSHGSYFLILRSVRRNKNSLCITFMRCPVTIMIHMLLIIRLTVTRSILVISTMVIQIVRLRSIIRSRKGLLCMRLYIITLSPNIIDLLLWPWTCSQLMLFLC